MADFAERRDLMVERQIRRRGIDNPDVLMAFRAVPREEFVPENMREFAYEDGPLPIGEGQTISQPYIVALMIDAAGVARRSGARGRRGFGLCGRRHVADRRRGLLDRAA
jgi:protein-L-isoaspartate O-methyltransferase